MEKIKAILFTLLLFTLQANSQNVSTLSGPGIGINDGLTMDSKGNLYGTDHEGYEVYKISQDGVVSEIASFSNHPNAIVFDDDDNLYISVPQGNKIYRITADGNISQYGPDIPNPNGLIFDIFSDTLFVTSYKYSTISKLAPDGNLSIVYQGSPLDGPLGLTYDNNNILYISNFNDGKMFKVENNSLIYFATIPGAYLGSNYFSTGYIIFLNDFIYATGYATHKIYRVNLNGDVFEYAGTGIPGTINGPAANASFYCPNGIISNTMGDTLFISGYVNHIVRLITDINTGVKWKEIKTGFNCYPNPAYNKFTIDYFSDISYYAILELKDVNGKTIKNLSSHIYPGSNKIIFNTIGISPGLYFLSIIGNSINYSRKILIR